MRDAWLKSDPLSSSAYSLMITDRSQKHVVNEIMVKYGQSRVYTAKAKDTAANGPNFHYIACREEPPINYG